MFSHNCLCFFDFWIVPRSWLFQATLETYPGNFSGCRFRGPCYFRLSLSHWAGWGCGCGCRTVFKVVSDGFREESYASPGLEQMSTVFPSLTTNTFNGCRQSCKFSLSMSLSSALVKTVGVVGSRGYRSPQW